MIDRRVFLQKVGAISSMLYMSPLKLLGGQDVASGQKPFPPETDADVYVARGESADIITNKLLDSIGGIESLIDKEDIVILKPNAQWWNQGMTNTDVMAAFIQAVLNIPGFKGEIIIAENHQSKIDNSRGWTTDKRNGKFNLNELVEYFNNKGYKNVTKYHWHRTFPDSPSSQLKWNNKGGVIFHPSEGDGYVWPDDLYYICPYGHKTIFSYPIFTSAYSGVTIDFKNGAFKDGNYTGQPVKFINFSALNHHSSYSGVTASVKNYMGVVDMGCGYPASNPPDTYNTHHIGASGYFKLLFHFHDYLKGIIPGWKKIYHAPTNFRFWYTGGVLGKYMKVIRKADLNIITAIRVGWGSRIDTSMSFPANTVLASAYPVALDYWAADRVLLPATKKANAPEEFVKLNDPKIENGPLRKFLQECRRELGGTINPAKIQQISV